MSVTRRWTAAQVAQLTARAVSPFGVIGESQPTTAQIQRPSKYRSQKCIVDGIRFDSKLESRCYRWLRLRQSSGEISFLLRQVPFFLEGGVVYRADFVAVLNYERPLAEYGLLWDRVDMKTTLRISPGVEVVDATGKLTQTKANKLKQVKARYGIDVVLWTDKAA